MNLNEIRVIISEMQKLRKAQESAKNNLIKFLCGDEETFKALNDELRDIFSVESFRWKYSLEHQNGKIWADVFALMSDDPTDDQVLDSMFRIAKREPQTIGKLISEYWSESIKEKTELAEFIAKYQFPVGHHEWVQLRINPKNAAIKEIGDHFGTVETELRHMWHSLIDYAIGRKNRNWETKQECIELFTERYEKMLKEFIPHCVDTSKKYLASLEWLDEYEDWRSQNPEEIPTMTMETLEKMCETH